MFVSSYGALGTQRPGGRRQEDNLMNERSSFTLLPNSVDTPHVISRVLSSRSAGFPFGAAIRPSGYRSRDLSFVQDEAGHGGRPHAHAPRQTEKRESLGWVKRGRFVARVNQ